MKEEEKNYSYRTLTMYVEDEELKEITKAFKESKGTHRTRSSWLVNIVLQHIRGNNNV